MASAKRTSKKIVTGVTAAQYLEAMGVYATQDAMADKLIAKMNADITKVREKYDGDIDDCRKELEAQREIIQAYATENKEVLFAERRHIDNVHGKVGFRLGTPKLKTLPKWTWDKVLEKMKAVLPEYVRTTTEVDKAALLLDRDNETIRPHLNDVGVYVDQDESFYIELKKEEEVAG